MFSLIENARINHAFMRKFASEEISSALRSAGYREQTISFLSSTLSELISRDLELDANEAKKIHNQLLALLDSEELSQDSQEEVSEVADN